MFFQADIRSAFFHRINPQDNPLDEKWKQVRSERELNEVEKVTRLDELHEEVDHKGKEDQWEKMLKALKE